MTMKTIAEKIKWKSYGSGWLEGSLSLSLKTSDANFAMIARRVFWSSLVCRKFRFLRLELTVSFGSGKTMSLKSQFQTLVLKYILIWENLRLLFPQACKTWVRLSLHPREFHRVDAKVLFDNNPKQLEMMDDVDPKNIHFWLDNKILL